MKDIYLWVLWFFFPFLFFGFFFPVFFPIFLFCLFFLFVIETNYNDENSARNLLLIYFTLLGEHIISWKEVPSFLSARSHFCSCLPLSMSFVYYP